MKKGIYTVTFLALLSSFSVAALADDNSLSAYKAAVKADKEKLASDKAAGASKEVLAADKKKLKEDVKKEKTAKPEKAKKTT